MLRLTFFPNLIEIVMHSLETVSWTLEIEEGPLFLFTCFVVVVVVVVFVLFFVFAFYSNAYCPTEVDIK